MANQFLHTDLTVGNCRRQSFSPAYPSELELDAIHLVNGDCARISNHYSVCPREVARVMSLD